MKGAEARFPPTHFKNKMNIRTILPGIHYTGVNDRTTQLFEGLWPLPNGVSYNSYLVEGTEKTAMIDSVAIAEFREFHNNLLPLTGGRQPDYLVINHMEPDHSGSIPEIVKTFPGIKIVGNTQTIGMIKGFYKLEDDDLYLEVKDGAEIDLGGVTLRFLMTPMVHWPETMMVYVPERKLIFSGDGFGTFGGLNGGVTDEEMDTEVYIREMYRYYSNIVGKYGKFVQKALAKCAGLDIEWICSTHGPVWHERAKEVIGITDRLSRYEPERGVTIIYGSMYGNTAELAEEIARSLAENGVRKIKVHNASTASLSDMISDAFRYEGLIVGSATYSMTIFPPVEALMRALEVREIQNRVFATFGSFTWAKGAVVTALNAYAERMKMPVLASTIMKQSADADTLAEARELGKRVAALLTK